MNQPAPSIPVTHKQAQKFPYWRGAMKAEFDALMKNSTWDFVPPDHARNIVPCKYKTRLVAKGFTQRTEIDFPKTFSDG